jgi:hypothetical protein
MQSLEHMETQCRAFGGVITQAVGSHLVQVVKEPGRLGGGASLVYRIDGWGARRTEVIAVLAGTPPEATPTYGEYLENRVNAGLHIGPVTGG